MAAREHGRPGRTGERAAYFGPDERPLRPRPSDFCVAGFAEEEGVRGLDGNPD